MNERPPSFSEYRASSGAGLRTLQDSVERFISGRYRGISGHVHEGEVVDNCFSAKEYALGRGL